jgi:ubiquinone/menaquinone biosynthesis C-methylase UbiE
MSVVFDSLSVSALQVEVKRYYHEIERYDWVTDTKYPEKIFHQLRAGKVASMVNNICRDNQMSVLDVGCGTGLITRKIRSNHIAALDMNEWALQRAKLHTSGKISFIPGDAENLPFPADNFDVVICTEVLEHLVRPDLALREIYRVLKPGSFFVGSVPTKSIIWKYRKYISSSSPVTEPFHNNYTIHEFRPLLDDFDIINMQYGVFGLTLFFKVRKPIITV